MDSSASRETNENQGNLDAEIGTRVTPVRSSVFQEKNPPFSTERNSWGSIILRQKQDYKFRLVKGSNVYSLFTSRICDRMDLIFDIVSALLKTVLQILLIKYKVFLLPFHLLSFVKILIHNSAKGTSLRRPYLKIYHVRIETQYLRQKIMFYLEKDKSCLVIMFPNSLKTGLGLSDAMRSIGL